MPKRSRLTQLFSRRAVPALARGRRRLRSEALESRRLLAVDFIQQDQVFGDRVEDVGLEERAEAGNAVAVDGDLMVVGAARSDVNGFPDTGAAFVYRRSDNGTPSDTTDDFWQQQARLTASDAAQSDFFGISVAISGETVVVGSYPNSMPR